MLSDWLIANDLPADFENLKEDVLAAYLRRFYAEVRTKDGRQYGKKSMLAIRSAIFRFLTQPPNNVTFNILTDTAFIAAKNVLTGVCRKLKATGQDFSKHHPSIKKDDLEKMYDSEVLSHKDPVALQRKVFFETVLHFGRRGREGLREMKKSDIVFKLDENGKEYATLAGNPLEKNHQGFSSREGEHSQIMYGTGDVNCPFTSLKFYLTKLNEKCEALFQRAKDVNWEDSPAWYVNSPVGVNPLGNMMPAISKDAQLSMIYTNHCIRATTVSTLRQAGIHPTDIVAVTGHRNVQSLDHYCQGPNALVRHHMSETLARSSSKSGQEMQALVPPSAVDTGPKIPAISEQALLPLPIESTVSELPSKSGQEVQALFAPPPTTILSETNSTVSLSQTSMTKITESSLGSLFRNVVFNNSTITVNVHQKQD